MKHEPSTDDYLHDILQTLESIERLLTRIADKVEAE